MGSGLLGENGLKLSQSDRNKALMSEYEALETGQDVEWRASDGQSSGRVVVGQSYQVGSQNCRQYSHTFTIHDVPQFERGSACRNDTTNWSPLT